MSFKNDNNALTATFAEALERYIWSEETDYFRSPVVMSVEAMSRDATAILPERFVGASSEQRAGNPRLRLALEDEFLWIRGYSLTQRRDVYVPAQLASAAHFKAPFKQDTHEPRIRTPITTGLATWPTKDGAILGGALEVLERDAYMIMWLNQLTLPRIDLAPWRAKDKALDDFLTDCERYRFRIHAMRLPTDAPTDAVCAVVEDTTDHLPRFSIGIKAHRDIGRCLEGAITEAMRARQNARGYERQYIDKVLAKPINHMERNAYWTEARRAAGLSFLIEGPIEFVAPSPWSADTPSEHLERIRKWALEKHYEMLTVSMGSSAKNPLPWHIEMVIMPDLQPMHQDESFPYGSGTRLKEIPEQFGYKARGEPFLAEPHPFS